MFKSIQIRFNQNNSTNQFNSLNFDLNQFNLINMGSINFWFKSIEFGKIQIINSLHFGLNQFNSLNFGFSQFDLLNFALNQFNILNFSLIL